MSLMCGGTTRFDRKARCLPSWTTRSFVPLRWSLLCHGLYVSCIQSGHQSNAELLPVSRTFSGRRLRWISANPSPGQALDKAIHRTRGRGTILNTCTCVISFFQRNWNAWSYWIHWVSASHYYIPLFDLINHGDPWEYTVEILSKRNVIWQRLIVLISESVFQLRFRLDK